MVFVGPSTDVMESLGLKHTARQCAIDASLPIVPGSAGLVVDEEEAVGIACQIGFPVSEPALVIALFVQRPCFRPWSFLGLDTYGANKLVRRSC